MVLSTVNTAPRSKSRQNSGSETAKTGVSPTLEAFTVTCANPAEGTVGCGAAINPHENTKGNQDVVHKQLTVSEQGADEKMTGMLLHCQQ